MPTLKDPVDKDQKKKEEIKQAEKDEAQNIDNMLKGVTLDDLKTIPKKYAKAIHPFDGYPLKYATIGGKKICISHIVVFNNNKPVFQDPSGINQSITRKDGKEMVVTLLSPPNRTLMDYDVGRNTHIIFDRELTLDDGKVVKWVAFIPSHSVRAQIMFKHNAEKDMVEPDSDFFMFDLDQSARLRRVMDNILKPNRKAERDARAILGESKEELDDIPNREGEE